MPHLQDNVDAEEKVSETHLQKVSTAQTTANAIPDSSSPATKEAREVSLSVSGRQVSASPNESTTRPTATIASFETAEEERTPEDRPNLSPRSHPPKQIITPSPYGVNRSAVSTTMSRHHGPMVSIYGSTRLFPSPIRVKKSPSKIDSDSERSSPNPQMVQPSNLRYAGPADINTPSRPELLRMMSSDSSSSRGKRPTTHILYEDSVKRQKANSLAIGSADSTSFDDSVSSGGKKPVISPTSSGEKGEEDSTSSASRSSAHHYGSGRPYMHGGYRPTYPYGAPPPPPYSGSYHHVYHSYPPQHPHVVAGNPHLYPPPYPHHPHAAMAAQYRPRYPFPVQYGRAVTTTTKPPTETATLTSRVAVGEGATDPSGKTGELSGTPSTPGPEGVSSTNQSTIKSVADWQQAAISTGKYPSAGRCLPLKEPIPSRYWGEAEKTKDVVLPDFHRLVNYPDYLAKSRSPSSSENGSPPAGKKNCVMCGKLRVCSASSLVNRNKAKQDAGSVAADTKSTLDDDDCTSHIIPRQNKGLCTACDVTVWVVVTDGMEIKWCKGCKNFRPWAAFGDKGSATKCVRCRDRQREKYAMQKDEIRLRRYKRSDSSASGRGDAAAAKGENNSTINKIWEEEIGEEDTHLAAARGLRNLMNAGATT